MYQTKPYPAATFSSPAATVEPVDNDPRYSLGCRGWTGRGPLFGRLALTTSSTKATPRVSGISETMRLRFPLTLALVCIFSNSVVSQNLDFGYVYSSGEYRGKAGAGVGAAAGLSSIDLNPGGLAKTPYRCFSLSQSVPFYSYDLFRKNTGVAAIQFDWNRIRYRVDHLLFALPVRRNLVIASGYITKSSIFQNNKRRAITWSSLFNQDTHGGLNALVLSASLSLNQDISIGMTLYRYLGKVVSEITGENHGIDSDKWARLESRFSGYNYRIGLVLARKKYSLGFVLEPSSRLDISVSKRISEDRLYEYLFPGYDRTEWATPVVCAIGFAYTGPGDILFTMDFERRWYKESEIQLNLFEFGGQPNWKDSNIVRVGFEFRPFAHKSLPIRIGYAYIPQLYASNTSTGLGNSILEYADTSQNIKHLFSVGTTLDFSKASLSTNLEYASVGWHRDLATSWLIKDIYREKTFVLSLNIVYPF